MYLDQIYNTANFLKLYDNFMNSLNFVNITKCINVNIKSSTSM